YRDEPPRCSVLADLCRRRYNRSDAMNTLPGSWRPRPARRSTACILGALYQYAAFNRVPDRFERSTTEERSRAGNRPRFRYWLLRVRIGTLAASAAIMTLLLTDSGRRDGDHACCFLPANASPCCDGRLPHRRGCYEMPAGCR